MNDTKPLDSDDWRHILFCMKVAEDAVGRTCDAFELNYGLRGGWLRKNTEVAEKVAELIKEGKP